MLGAVLPEDSYRLTTRPTSVCLQSKQVSGRCSMPRSTPCSQTPRLPQHLRTNTLHRLHTVRHSTQSYHINFNKLRLLNVNTQMCKSILDFLLNRNQVVKFNSQLSEPLTLSTGAPQGCVLSPLLFTLFTNDWRSSNSSTLIFNFSDDTTIEGLITNADESAYREVEQVVDWCTNTDLQLNEANTKEMITDFEEE